MQHIIGWDIGGAHVKAALLDTQGQVVKVYQQPCPLWKGLDQLRLAVTEIMHDLPSEQFRHAVTMTGELVDLFANRDDGVAQIIATMSALLANDDVFIFAGKTGFLNAAQVANDQIHGLLRQRYPL